MDKKSIDLIRESWKVIASSPDIIINFYNNLFEISPESKKFFPEDLSRQSEKLAYTIGFAVENLDRLDEIKDSIEDLGRTHNELNIEAKYYGYVKDALILTIKNTMNENYSSEIGESWDKALTYISEVMINAPKVKKEKKRNLLQKLFSKKQ